MDFTFDKKSAQGADRGGYISESGVYTGMLTKAECFTTSGGAKGIEFAFESDDGSKADYIKVITRKKDGDTAFGLGHINALMGLLGLAKAATVADGDKVTLPSLCNKKISVGLQREEYQKNAGGIGYKMNVAHFFDAQSKKTYSELSENKEAKTHLRPIVDKLIQGVSNANATLSPANTSADDLPF